MDEKLKKNVYEVGNFFEGMKWVIFIDQTSVYFLEKLIKILTFLC